MKHINKQIFITFLSMVMPCLLASTFGKGCNACYINPNDFTDTDTFFGTVYGVTINGHFQIIENDDVCRLTRDTLLYTGSLNAIKVNAFRAIVCGSNGKILRSPSNMNYTIWDSVKSGTTEDLNDIDNSFFSIYIVGNGGTILKSTDDGETFFQLNSGTTLDLNEVQCVSYDSVRIAGDSLLSMYTTNGGITWSRQYVYVQGDATTGFRVDLQTLHFLNFNTGWTAGQHYVFKTTNGGLNWSTRFKQTQQYDNYSNSIYFHNKDSGIVVGNRGDIQFTTNGGNSWFYSIDLQNITTKNLNKIIYNRETGLTAAVGDSGVIVYTDSVLLAIQQLSNQVPDEYNLRQNYPNPFNPTTTIEFALPEISNVKLLIYDIRGSELETLIDGKLSIGIYKVDFDASQYPSGVYFYQIQTEHFTETKKMVLVR